jgi:hypothetical protein
MTQIFSNKEIKGFCFSLTESHDEAEELFSLLLESYVKYPKSFIEADKKGYLVAYCCRSIYNEYRNRKSNFNKFKNSECFQHQYEETHFSQLSKDGKAFDKLMGLKHELHDAEYWMHDEIEIRVAIDKCKKKRCTKLHYSIYGDTNTNIQQNTYQTNQGLH